MCAFFSYKLFLYYTFYGYIYIQVHSPAHRHSKYQVYGLALQRISIILNWPVWSVNSPLRIIRNVHVSLRSKPLLRPYERVYLPNRNYHFIFSLSLSVFCIWLLTVSVYCCLCKRKIVSQFGKWKTKMKRMRDRMEKNFGTYFKNCSCLYIGCVCRDGGEGGI